MINGNLSGIKLIGLFRAVGESGITNKLSNELREAYGTFKGIIFPVDGMRQRTFGNHPLAVYRSFHLGEASRSYRMFTETYRSKLKNATVYIAVNRTHNFGHLKVEFLELKEIIGLMGKARNRG